LGSKEIGYKVLLQDENPEKERITGKWHMTAALPFVKKCLSVSRVKTVISREL
jgi:hypothetical protein